MDGGDDGGGWVECDVAGGGAAVGDCGGRCVDRLGDGQHGCDDCCACRVGAGGDGGEWDGGAGVDVVEGGGWVGADQLHVHVV